MRAYSFAAKKTGGNARGAIMDFTFFAQSALMGVGLAMDAFSVSLANGLHEPTMPKRKTALIAGTFGLFQWAMPLIGWLLVKTVVQWFSSAEKIIPFLALALLGFIGVKMIVEGVKGGNADDEPVKTGIASLLVQGVATSVDALSVGFAIESYAFSEAFVYSAIIAVVTFIICVIGVFSGKKFGMRFKGKATIVGGIILVLIGLEIFIKGVFF